MSITRTIYASKPFGFDHAVLSGILLDARRLNKRDGITGALVCRRDIYLQLLEGPDEKVRETYARICRDDRHANITLLTSETVTDRLFGEWDMLHDPAKSWIWTIDEIANGKIESLAEGEALEVFTKLANQVGPTDL